MCPTSPMPIYCAHGDAGHQAAYLVEGPTRAEVVCERHLPASKRWVGLSARVTPLPGHDPPPEQLRLL